MSRKVLGIDIQYHSVTAVLLNSRLREKRIDDYLYIPMSDPDDLENGLIAALEALTETMDLSGCDYVVSLPSDQFAYRNLQIPFSNPKKIRMVLPFELESTFPNSAEDLVIDFHTLNRTASGDQTELIAAAIKKTQLDPYIEALTLYKVDPELITTSGLPTALCLAQLTDPGEDQLFLEISKAYSTLFVLVNGRIQLIRSFPLPSKSPSKSKLLCTHIQRTLAAFEETTQLDFQPLEVVVSGSGLDESNIIEDITRILQVLVKPANLAERLNLPVEKHFEDLSNSFQMDNALGLALMEIEGWEGLNFHKNHFAAQKFLSKHKSNLIRTGILATAVLALIFFNVLIDSYILNNRVRRIDNQITQIFKATFPEVKTIREPFQQMKAKVQEIQKNTMLQSETGHHIRSVDILNSISEKIPPKIKVDLNRLVIQTENVLISGTTDTFNSVDEIKGLLEQINFFDKVTISSANTDRSGKEIRFMLKAEL
jgi:general secretion pathway protein L